MSLIKNSVWNIIGIMIPIVVAIPAMGLLARHLGVEKFGLFTLAYAVVGYASIFDAGLSRAVIRAVAMHLKNEELIAKILGSATRFVILLSVVASFVVFVSAEKVVALLSVSEQARDDAVHGFQWLSLAVTPLLLSSVWFSYLEGKSHFAKLNALRATSGIFVALLPLFFLLKGVSFTSAIQGLVLGRMLTMIIAYCWGLEHMRGYVLTSDVATLKNLLRFGGWLTVSNIVSPMMVYFDRFFLSSFAGAAAVAFYTAPAEAISRLLALPLAVSRAIFPRLSEAGRGAEDEAKLAYGLLAAASSIVAILIWTFAEDIMYFWMGPDYIGNPVTVLRVLSIGFVFNSLAQIPYSRIQAAGNSHVTALIHLAELLPYIAVLYWLVIEFSIIGAAYAWTFRVGLDYFLMEFFARRMHKRACAHK